MSVSPTGISLIVRTYNRPSNLSLCLYSIRKQSHIPTEVIIADDGSGEATKKVIDSARKDYPVPLHHLWQEDKGHRMSRARNMGLRKAKEDYIIMLDGDIFIHRDYIKDVLSHAKKKELVQGRLVNLTKAETTLTIKQRRVYLSLRGLFVAIGRTGIPWPALCLRYSQYVSPDRVLGGLNGYWKEDAVRINGYDERFEGWGYEDWDFAVRLKKAGVRLKRLRFGGIAYHLWHKKLGRERIDINKALVNQSLGSHSSRCKEGYDSHKEAT